MRSSWLASGFCLVACAGSAPPTAAAPAQAPLACPPKGSGPPRLVVRRAWREDSRYRLVSTTVALDGQVVYRSSNESELRAPLAIIYDQPATAGPHQLLTAYTVRTTNADPHLARGGARFYVPHEHWLVVPEQGTECATLSLSATGRSRVR